MLRGESADTPWSIEKHTVELWPFTHEETQNPVVDFRAFGTTSRTDHRGGKKEKGSRIDFPIY